MAAEPPNRVPSYVPTPGGGRLTPRTAGRVDKGPEPRHLWGNRPAPNAGELRRRAVGSSKA